MNKTASSDKPRYLTNAQMAAALRSPLPTECIDLITVTFPVVAVLPESQSTDSLDRLTRSQRRDHILGDVRTKSDPRRGTTYTWAQIDIDDKRSFHFQVTISPDSIKRQARVEVKPRLWLQRSGQVLASIDDIIEEILYDIFATLEDLEYVVLGCGPADDDVLITRLDVTRDVAPISNATEVMETLARTPQHGSRVAHIYYRPGTSIPQSVYIGSKRSGHLVVYNKHKQDPTAKPGTLRFEQQVRAADLRTWGIRSTLDLTQDRLNSLSQRWLDYLIATLEADAEARIRRLVGAVQHHDLLLLLGHLCAQDNGIQLHTPERDTRRIRALRREYDVAHLKDLFDPRRADRPRRLLPGYGRGDER